MLPIFQLTHVLVSPYRLFKRVACAPLFSRKFEGLM